MAAANIEPADVIRLVEQYLKENKLFNTLQTLQNETSVSLNTVDSIETFVNDINAGHWDVVLKVVKTLKLPDHKLIDLYEQITIELIELRETRAAKWLVYKTEPMLKMNNIAPDRYKHLQNLVLKCERSLFDHREAYRDSSTKEQRRAAIANDLKREVSVVPPQRLLSLISDALKWQKHEGSLPSSLSIDIFTGKAHMEHADEETYPNVLHKHCVKPIAKDNKPIFVCCADFSPDGHYIVVGYSTGVIELRNSTTGRLTSGNQASTNLLVTPSRQAPLSLCFSVSELLAVGDKCGDISVWRLESGQLVQVFQTAHMEMVSCLVFNSNRYEILSGGHDGSIKLHGMHSNKTIRDFKGHRINSHIEGLAYSRDFNYVVSGSSDKTVKIWNAKTAQLLYEHKSSGKIHTVLLMPRSLDVGNKDTGRDIFLIGDRTRCLQLIDLEGKVRAKLIDNLTGQDSDNPQTTPRSVDFLAACTSPKGGWIYAVDSYNLYCFNHSTKKVQKTLLANDDTSDNDLIGVKHHPFLNILATYDTGGNLKLWKP